MFLFLRDGGGFCYKMFCTLIEALDNNYWALLIADGVNHMVGIGQCGF